MTTPLDGLLAALNLDNTDSDTRDTFIARPSQWMPFGRIFGGQVVAQSIIAAMRTIEHDRIVHSMHGYFLRPGDVNLPITFSVDRIHDGRSFSRRRTQAYQDEKPIFSMIASFQTADDGLDHQAPMPAELPEPESLPSAAEALATGTDPVSRFWASERPFDIRHIPSPIYFGVEGARVAHQAIWFRALGTLPDDPNLHRAALAYASDFSILEPIYRRHGVSWSTPSLKSASLDHALWWHRFGRVDEWLLHTQESPTATGGRGLSLGRIYSRNGTLLASVAQEGMVRVPNAPGR